MRVVVVGATGNVGTSVLHSLAREPAVDSIVGVARRLPRLTFPKTEWVSADVVSDDVVGIFRGADAVVHLAWLIQPSRDSALLRAVNVDGSARVFRAAGGAGGWSERGGERGSARSCTRRRSARTHPGRRTGAWTRAGPPRASSRRSTPPTRRRWSACSPSSSSRSLPGGRGGWGRG